MELGRRLVHGRHAGGRDDFVSAARQLHETFDGARFEVEAGIVAGGIDRGAGRDDLVDAVEQVVGQDDVGRGELRLELSGPMADRYWTLRNTRPDREYVASRPGGF